MEHKGKGVTKRRVLISTILVLATALVSVFSLGIFGTMSKSQERPEAASVPGFTFGSNGSGDGRKDYENNSIFFIKNDRGMQEFYNTLAGRYSGHSSSSEQADYSGKTVYLMANVTLEDVNFKNTELNIGEVAKLTYNGVFDGRGYSISYKSGQIKGKEDGVKYAHDYYGNWAYFGGLFDVLGSSGTVRNLQVKNVEFYISRYKTGPYEHDMDGAGGIVGTNGGTIENCVVHNLKVTSAQDNWENCMVGGIVSVNNGTVRNCMVTGTYSINSQLDGLLQAGIKALFFRAKNTHATNCIFAANITTDLEDEGEYKGPYDYELGDNFIYKNGSLVDKAGNAKSMTSDVSTALDNNESAWVQGSWNGYNYYPRAFRWPSTSITFKSTTCDGVTFVPRLYTFYGGERVTEWDSNNEIAIPRPDYVDWHADLTNCSSNKYINAYSFTIYGAPYLVRYESDTVVSALCWNGPGYDDSGTDNRITVSQSRTITPALGISTRNVTFAAVKDNIKYKNSLSPYIYEWNTWTPYKTGSSGNPIVLNMRVGDLIQWLGNNDSNRGITNGKTYIDVYKMTTGGKEYVVRYLADCQIDNLKCTAHGFPESNDNIIGVYNDGTITPVFEGGYRNVTFKNVENASLYDGENIDTAESKDYTTSLLQGKKIKWNINKDYTQITYYEEGGAKLATYVAENEYRFYTPGYDLEFVVNDTMDISPPPVLDNISVLTFAPIDDLVRFKQRIIPKLYQGDTLVKGDGSAITTLQTNEDIVKYKSNQTVTNGLSITYSYEENDTEYTVKYILEDNIALPNVSVAGAGGYWEGQSLVAEGTSYAIGDKTIQPVLNGGYAKVNFKRNNNTNLYKFSSNVLNTTPLTTDYAYGDIEYQDSITWEISSDYKNIIYSYGSIKLAKYVCKDGYLIDMLPTGSIDNIEGTVNVEPTIVYNMKMVNFTPILNRDKYGANFLPKIYENGTTDATSVWGQGNNITLALQSGVDIKYIELTGAVGEKLPLEYTFTKLGKNYTVRYIYSDVALTPNIVGVSSGKEGWSHNTTFSTAVEEPSISICPSITAGKDAVFGLLTKEGDAGYSQSLTLQKKQGEGYVTVDTNATNTDTRLVIQNTSSKVSKLVIRQFYGETISVQLTKDIDYYATPAKNIYSYTITIRKAGVIVDEYIVTYDISTIANSSIYEVKYSTNETDYTDFNTILTLEEGLNKVDNKIVIRSYSVTG